MEPSEIRAYYTNDVGSVPAPIEVAIQHMPEAIAGYMQIRSFILDTGSSRPDAMPKEYVNLIFAVLDVVSSNLEGALNHARAALDAGLPWHSFMQSMAQTWIVFGFASSWGKTGHKLVQQLRDEGFGTEPSE